MTENAILIKGSSPSLVAEAVREAISESLSAEDRSMGVDDYDSGTSAREIVDTCRTPPFIVERRCVIVRDSGRFGGKTDSSGELETLLNYLESPSDFTTIVFVPGGGTYSTKLVKAVKDVGKVVEVDPGWGKQATKWVDQQISEAPISFSKGAISAIKSHLGENVDRVPQILERAVAVYGSGSTISEKEIFPILGEAGNVVPWDLTDAIDKGDADLAVALTDRMVIDGGKHPIQVLTSLSSHFSAMLALDGAPVSNGKDAAEITGLKDYPAKKAWDQTRKLGGQKVIRAVRLIAEAESDLKGGSEISRLTSVDGPASHDGLLVLELLVARLAFLGRTA